MDALFTGKMGARHLSQIKEESDSREHSGCFLPPIALQQHLPGRAGDPGVDEAQRQEARHLTPLALFEEQQTLEGHRTLLEELSLIEANLRASLHLDFERLQEAEFLRQQENKQLRQDLCFLSLSQRVAKSWASSYFRAFPMHIYCLPIQAANYRRRRWGLKKRR